MSIERQGVENHEFKQLPHPSIIQIIVSLGLFQHGPKIHGILDNITVVGRDLLGHHDLPADGLQRDVQPDLRTQGLVRQAGGAICEKTHGPL